MVDDYARKQRRKHFCFALKFVALLEDNIFFGKL
jgi:hypothetical protein